MLPARFVVMPSVVERHFELVEKSRVLPVISIWCQHARFLDKLGMTFYYTL